MTDPAPSSTAPGEPSARRARWGRRAARAAFRVLYDAQAHGWERVPATGPVVLASNHIGFLDGALLIAMAPRPVHVLVLDRVFVGGVGWLLRTTGQIPLNQGIGDRTALGQAIAVLGRGGLVGIFPEGARGRGDVAAAGRGVAWLALQAGATVVPVACLGTRHTGDSAGAWPRLRSRLVMDFGDPVDLTGVGEGLPRRVAVDRAAEVVRDRLAAYVTEASLRHGIALPDDIPEGLLPEL